MSTEQLLMLPLWYVAFLLSVTCHEGAHAFAAWRGGDPTAYLGGQVSLNPIPHIVREPFGTVLVPLIAYFQLGWMMGWASAPYDPLWEDRHPKRAAWMAAAGPLANLLLALGAFGVLKLGMVAGIWTYPPATPDGFFDLAYDRLVASRSGSGAADALGRFCSIGLSLNVVLFLFNLIPLPPMDGSAVLAGLWPAARRARDRFRQIPMGGIIGLVIAWATFGYILGPVYGFVLDMLYR